MSHPIERVVIVGGGTAGWMTAAALSQYFKHLNLDICLIESSEIGTIGVGEATTPTIIDFCKSIGISIPEVMRETHATCKLGIAFQNWRALDTEFFHPFGLYGQAARSSFFDAWLRVKSKEDVEPLGHYSLACELAKQHKVAFPSVNPNTQFQQFDWALHFDATLFAKYLAKFSVARGVKHIDRKIIDVELSSENGFINTLTLEDGSKINGDLFIDCSGFHGLLMKKTLKIDFEDWSHWLPANRAYAAISETTAAPPPYTVARAHDAGWQWRIPLQNRMGNGSVYISDYISDDEALENFTQNISGKLLNDPRLIKFTTGVLKQAWSKNCIAIGLSAGFLEPLESTSISVIVTAIKNLRSLFPQKDCNPHIVEEFNQRSYQEFSHIRDFIIFHYVANQRSDTPFWRDIRDIQIPDSLHHKLELYKARGCLVKRPWETFHESSWHAILDGMHIYPNTYDPQADFYSEQTIIDGFKEIRKNIQMLAENAASHSEFLKNNHMISKNL